MRSSLVPAHLWELQVGVFLLGRCRALSSLCCCWDTPTGVPGPPDPGFGLRLGGDSDSQVAPELSSALGEIKALVQYQKEPPQLPQPVPLFPGFLPLSLNTRPALLSPSGRSSPASRGIQSRNSSPLKGSHQRRDGALNPPSVIAGNNSC